MNILDKGFTPMKAVGTVVFLGPSSGGFDVRTCPNSKDLAAFIVDSCNAATSVETVFARKLINSGAKNYIGGVLDTEKGDIEVIARYVSGKQPSEIFEEFKVLTSLIPMEAIGKILTEVMDNAVANGADSRSMPDEYVAVAHFLSFPEQYGLPKKEGE